MSNKERLHQIKGYVPQDASSTLAIIRAHESWMQKQKFVFGEDEEESKLSKALAIDNGPNENETKAIESKHPTPLDFIKLV